MASYVSIIVLIYIIFILHLIISVTGDFVHIKEKQNSELYMFLSENNMTELFQPYYECEGGKTDSKMTGLAWHYACKKSCDTTEGKSKKLIRIMNWRADGHAVDVYRISSTEICYTYHENIWGYCTTTQEVKHRVPNQKESEDLINEHVHEELPLLGSVYIDYSPKSTCEYFSDNTICGYEYMIEYRKANVIRKSISDMSFLHISQDSILTSPDTGFLELNDAIWWWDKHKILENKECHWRYGEKIECYHQETSDVLECPSIGFNYNLKTVEGVQTCKGHIYDIQGPSPFSYLESEEIKSTKALEEEYSEGKPTRDIQMVKGINNAFDKIEKSYCSSLCDMFYNSLSLSTSNTVIDTPIGLWRKKSSSQENIFFPCKATSSWQPHVPLSFCSGDDDIVVVNRDTGLTTLWKTYQDYVIQNKHCMKGGEDNPFAKQMIAQEDIIMDFWTGDTAVMKSPYNNIEWIRSDISNVASNPSWHSKVAVTKDMLKNHDSIEDLILSYVNNTHKMILKGTSTPSTKKTELIWNEMVLGAKDVFLYISQAFQSLIVSFKKMLMFVGGIILLFGTVKAIIWVLTFKERQALKVVSGIKQVSFADVPKKKRSKTPSRSRKIEESLM